MTTAGLRVERLRPSAQSWLTRAVVRACAAATVCAISSATLGLWHPAPALAEQGACAVFGTVEDASTHAPVQEVVVTVTSPSLQGVAVRVTDGAGGYRIPNLPPGSYEVLFEKPGFEPHRDEAVTLHADGAIRLNVLLVPAKLQGQAIIVVGRAPVIDVDSSSTGINVSEELTSRVPVSMPGAKGSASRSFETVAELAPGAQADAYGVSISGTTSPENHYLIDGLAVNNPAFSVIGTPLSIEFIKEVSVISGGYMPEYGRATGGILNAITKSGSNEFRGSAFMNIAPGVLEGPRSQVHRLGQTVVTDPGLSYMGDLGADVGGPIIRDKLWFYVGFDWAQTRYRLGRSLYRTLYDSSGQPLPAADGGNRTSLVPGSAENFYAQQDALQAIGKLTWAPDRKDRLTLSAFGTPTFSGGGGNYGIDPVTGQSEIGTGNSLYAGPLNGPYEALGHRLLGSSANVLLKWAREIDGRRATLNTSLGWHHESGGRLPSDGSAVGSRSGLAGVSNVWWIRDSPPHSIAEFERVPGGGCNPPASNPDLVPCPVSDYHTGGPELIDEQSLNRYEARTLLSYMFDGAGHHVIKAGLELELATFGHLKAYSGGRDYAESADGSYFLDGRQYGYLTGPDQPVVLDSIHNQTQSITAGGFVQESWSVLDQVTVNAGLRYDAQLLYAADGALAMSLPNQWSPRGGVIFDPTHEGEAKLFANFARYYESIPLDVMDRTGSGEPLLFSQHDATTCNPLSTSQQRNQCQQDSNRQPIGSPPNQIYMVSGAGRTPVDPNIKAPSNDEIVLGGDYELIHDGRIGLSYTKRWLNQTIEDMSRDEAQTYFLGNPGYGIAKDFPQALRRYDAVTLSFYKAFRQGWLAQASYTVSSLRGNYAGLFRAEDKQLDPNQNTDFDLRSLTVNRYGPLPGDHRHAFKAFGAKDFPVGESGRLTAGAGLRAYSGAPTNYLGAHVLYGVDQVYILPRGSGERLPWTFSADARLAYGFIVTPTNVLSVSIDVFNVFNFQAMTARDERYTNAPVAPVASGGIGALKNADGSAFDQKTQANPNFGRAVEYQAPRIFRFGLRMTF